MEQPVLFAVETTPFKSALIEEHCLLAVSLILNFFSVQRLSPNLLSDIEVIQNMHKFPGRKYYA